MLFTDIVGSTALSSRLSPEIADEARRGHFSILRQAVAEFGGTEVKNLGDGLMVIFPSASLAMACAVAMQQGVEQANRGAEDAVGLRVGLSGGEVSKEEEDYFGDPVVEAARLCALCDGGQILAADVVRLSAGRRNRHQCIPVGPLSLKGLSDPVETVELAWDPLGGVLTGSIPLPSRLAIRPEVGVVGREAELTLMADACKRVTGDEGSREILLVSGEAGQGKTTLVAEAARAAYDEGACVLFGHCEEDLAGPYQLFAEALGHYVAHVPEDRLRTHVEALGSDLAGLVPALASRIPDLPPAKATESDSERYLLFAAVVGLLTEISRDQLVVLALDDLQWADRGSLQLLGHLGASDLPLQVVVLATYRDSELSHASALIETLGALRRQDGVSRIELSGLDDTGVVDLMEAASGQTLKDDEVALAHAIYRETDGNPFFVTELLRHLAETGAFYRDDSGRWVAIESLRDAALPDGVREVIGARVVRLGKAAAEVLTVAAVIGRDFDVDVLVRATRTTEDEVLDALDAAVVAALVRELDAAPGRYSFAHALIQHTLYEDIGPTRRARTHRRVAEALEDLVGTRPGGRVGDLARHWFSATQAQDLDKALDYSRQAGDAALAALAPEDALRYYTQASEILAQASDADPVVALDLGIGLGTAQRQSGDPAYRATLLEVAHKAAELGDTERLVAAALANDRGVGELGSVDRDKIEVLWLALDHLQADHPDRAILLATVCSEMPFRSSLDERQPLADEAVALAEASGDDVTLVRVLNHIAIPFLAPQLLEVSLARSADALARADRIDDPVLLFEAAVTRQVVATSSCDIREADRCLAICDSLVNRLGQPTLSCMHAVQRAMRAQVAGDIDQAEQLANLVLQLGTESGQPDVVLTFGTLFMGAQWQRGTMGDLLPLIEQAVADNPELPALHAALSVAHAEHGDLKQAGNLLEKAAPHFDPPSTGAWLTEMTVYSEVAALCHMPNVAIVLFERLAAWADQFSASGLTAEGPVSHFLGDLAVVLERYDDADRYFARSAECCARMEARFHTARTNLSWGKMLLARAGDGDVQRGHDLLTEAHVAAVDWGYRAVQRRAEMALRGVN